MPRPTIFAARLLEPIPMLTGISQLGDDRLCIRIGHTEPIAFVRILQPHYAGIKHALELGLVELLRGDRPVGEVLSMLTAAELGDVTSPVAGWRGPALVP